MSIRNLSRIFIVSILSLLLVVSSAIAIPISWDPDPTYPDFWQQDPLLPLGNAACGPVSATNSLYWLAGKYGLYDLVGPSWHDVVEELEGYMNTDEDGTTSGDFNDGLWEYVMEAGYDKRIEQRSRLPLGCADTPTVEWIKWQVSKGADVEILLGWVEDNPDGYIDNWVNGHYVSVTGYNENNFFIANPWNDNNSNFDVLPFWPDMVSLTFDFDEYANTVNSYTKDYIRVDLNDPIITNPYNYVILAGAFSQSYVVPEPFTLVITGTGLICIAGWRRKKKVSP